MSGVEGIEGHFMDRLTHGPLIAPSRLGKEEARGS
jgi:hypothetical protein